MAKARSPQYPAIGLKEAVEKITAVYGQDYQNQIPRQVIAEHMGYASLNGKSLGVLSALGKYGLLEGRGNESRVSDLAVQIIAHASGTPERAEALKTAASKPELFAELDQRFQGGKASDQAMRSYLLTQRFIPSAADAAIRSYRETKQFVSDESRGYIQGDEEQPESWQATEIIQDAGSPHWMPRPVTRNIRVSIVDDKLEVSARLGDVESIDKLIKILETNKILFQTVMGANDTGNPDDVDEEGQLAKLVE